MKPSDVAEDVGIAAVTLTGYSIVTDRPEVAGIVAAIGGVALALSHVLEKQGH